MPSYKRLLPCAWTFCQRALAISARRARTAGETLRLRLAAEGAVPPFAALSRAQRARAAAEILARPAALIRRLPRRAGAAAEAGAAGAPSNSTNSACMV